MVLPQDTFQHCVLNKKFTIVHRVYILYKSRGISRLVTAIFRPRKINVSCSTSAQRERYVTTAACIFNSVIVLSSTVID